MMSASAIILLLCAAIAVNAQLGPVYVLQNYITVTPNNTEDRALEPPTFSEREYFEWESYDGWFNNPAHPEWGGAGKLFLASYQKKKLASVCDTCTLDVHHSKAVPPSPRKGVSKIILL